MTEHDESPQPDPPTKAVSAAAAQRGAALQALLTKLNLNVPEFSARSGIHITSIWAYITGEVDLAVIQQKTVEKLLGELGVTDTWAWQYFDIPKEVRRTWRTFRRPPLGHGDDPRDLYEFHLTQRTSGLYQFQAGDILIVDRGNVEAGILVASAEDRVYIGLSRDLPAQAQVMGELVRMSPGLAASTQSNAGQK